MKPLTDILLEILFAVLLLAATATLVEPATIYIEEKEVPFFCERIPCKHPPYKTLWVSLKSLTKGEKK